MARDLEKLLEQYDGPSAADPFAVSPPPPEGYRGYDYKPTMTPADLAALLMPPGSGQPHEPWAWTKDYPNLARFLGESVPLALMGLRAARGAALPARTLPVKEWAPEFVGPQQRSSPWAYPQEAAEPSAPPLPQSALAEMLVRAEATSAQRAAEPIMRLYRGEPKLRNPNVEPERQGQWWSRSVDRARGFAGPEGDVFYIDVPLSRMGDMKSKAYGSNYIVPEELRAGRKPFKPSD